MTVRVNRERQHRDGERPSARSTRHLEIALPAGVTYKTGDHLGVVPRNGLDQLRRVLLRFKLDAGLYLTITPHTNASTYLPVNEPVPLLGVLANRVELQDVAALRRLPVRWPRWAPALPAYGIGSLAIYWCLERLAREVTLRS